VTAEKHGLFRRCPVAPFYVPAFVISRLGWSPQPLHARCTRGCTTARAAACCSWASSTPCSTRWRSRCGIGGLRVVLRVGRGGGHRAGVWGTALWQGRVGGSGGRKPLTSRNPAGII